MDTTNANATIKCWVELYSDQLYTWAYYKISDRETAEDLVQEVFLAAVHSFKNFEGKSDPKTWLLSILKNKIADHFRKVYRTNANNTVSFNQFFGSNEDWISDQRPQQWKEDEEQHLLDNPDFKKTLTHCLEKLPANWKASIVLKFIEEKDSNEICQELQIAPTNYWQILHRSKLQLRKCLELNWFKK
ncbi:MAG: sigma-70 family RNA polymerase sigma factor [Bacteroidota bacterium]|nr:sigma-70 family RNA polymerase sigma factor [Bacteroidota bacterium]